MKISSSFSGSIKGMRKRGKFKISLGRFSSTPKGRKILLIPIMSGRKPMHLGKKESSALNMRAVVRL